MEDKNLAEFKVKGCMGFLILAIVFGGFTLLGLLWYGALGVLILELLSTYGVI